MSSPKKNPKPRRGPRAGGVERKHILQVATELFSEHGYQATTMRKIGTAAGVDAKLIHYYFGTKEDLFTAAILRYSAPAGYPIFSRNTARRQPIHPVHTTYAPYSPPSKPPP